MKTNKNSLIKIIIHILSISTIFFISLLLLQKYLELKVLHTLDLSIKDRIADYEETFNYLERLYENSPLVPVEELLANKTIYLHKSKPISFGAIEIKKLSDKNDYTSSESINYLKNNLKTVILSKAFVDTNLINEPIIEMRYAFFAKNGEFLFFTSQVLVGDILVYSGNIAEISISKNESDTESTFYIPSLQVYVQSNQYDIAQIKSLLFLFIFITYTLFLALINYKKLHNNLSSLREQTTELQKDNLEINKAILFLKELDYLSHHKTYDSFLLINIIKNFLSIQENDIVEKKLKFLLDEPALNADIKGRKSHWQIFIGAILELLIKEAPPGSFLSCALTCTKNDEDEIYQITFKDGFPLKLKLQEKIFSNSYEYVPPCNLKHLITQMNVFVNFSFCEEEGNIITIVYINKKVPLRKESANVVFLAH
jgi:hypothetical protein